MADGSLLLNWRQQSEKNDYWYGESGTRFFAQKGVKAPIICTPEELLEAKS